MWTGGRHRKGGQSLYQTNAAVQRQDHRRLLTAACLYLYEAEDTRGFKLKLFNINFAANMCADLADWSSVELAQAPLLRDLRR